MNPNVWRRRRDAYIQSQAVGRERCVDLVQPRAVVQVEPAIDRGKCQLRRRITVGGEVAVFERVRNLRFINRFGEEVVRQRRCCRYRDQPGSVAPLDVKLGMDGCFGFSPLIDVPDLHAGR